MGLLLAPLELVTSICLAPFSRHLYVFNYSLTRVLPGATLSGLSYLSGGSGLDGCDKRTAYSII